MNNELKSIASQVKTMKDMYPDEPIYIVMNSSNWVNTFKCITSINECEVKVSPTIPDKEILLLPERLYNSKRKFYEPE